MIGPGRPAKSPEVISVRDLTEDEVRAMRPGKSAAVKAFKDSHHLVARLFAAGLRPGEVAERAGYSGNRISTLLADPSFQNLISEYRREENIAFALTRDDYYDRATRARNIALRLVEDKLADVDPDDVTIRELMGIHDSLADRTGYGKRSTQVNVNVDFAAQLDRAIKRSASAADTETGQTNSAGQTTIEHREPRPLPVGGDGSLQSPSRDEAVPQASSHPRDIPRRRVA